jgi:hypothetical protein
MLQLAWKVTKKVTHPQTQKDVTREGTITSNYVDPKSADWIDDALAICGGDSTLAAKVFNFGLKSWVRQQETNKLGKVDEVSKGLKKAIDGFVAMGMDEKAARTLILANPDLSSKLANAKFEQFVSTSIEDFASYQMSDPDEKGVKTSRFPDVTEVGSDEEKKEGEEAAS